MEGVAERGVAYEEGRFVVAITGFHRVRAERLVMIRLLPGSTRGKTRLSLTNVAVAAGVMLLPLRMEKGLATVLPFSEMLTAPFASVEYLTACSRMLWCVRGGQSERSVLTALDSASKHPTSGI